MKIFITGSNGFVGRNLSRLYDYPHVVISHTRKDPLKANLSYNRPDVIINCAAEIYDVNQMWNSNVDVTLDCLEYVRKHPTTKMIQIGSSAEYGPVSRPSKETDRINPVDIYQATKGSATLMCQGYARSYNLDICIARPYSIFGPYEKPHRLFPRLWRAFNYFQPMQLFHGVHDFIYIDDFVRGIDLLIKQDDKPLGDIINFGSGIQYTNEEVLRLFEKITNKIAPIEIINKMNKAYESDIWVCDTTYAKEKYNFEVKYSLEDGIREFLKKADYN